MLRPPLDLPPGLTQPRAWTTQRDHQYRTYGGHYAATAAALGQPFMPWQRYTADVAGEVDGNGIFRYSIVLVTVPRQSGKTTTDQSIGTTKCLSGPNRRVWYTAQTGQDATEKFLEMADTFEGSTLLKPSAKVRRSNGSAALTFVNGSRYRPHPPTPNSLHGKQSDHNTIDEAWAFTAKQGADLRQAITPTTTTRRMKTGQRPQLFIYSTEGTIESTYLNPLLEEARAGSPDIALLDWGIGPDDDPTDLEAIARHHPAYGHLLTMETLQDAAAVFKDSPGEFARAYGNVRTGATERLIPAGPFLAAAWQDDMPAGRPVIGAAAGIDGVDVTITVSIRVHPELVVTAVVRDGHHDGTHWALGRLKDLQGEHGAPIVIDRRGPSAALADAAERAGLTLLPIDTAGVATAHANMYAGITHPEAPTWRYRPHFAFDGAAELATRRYFTDGAWVLGRRASVGSISALEAAALSSWGVDHLPVEAGVQLF
jgi:hypothetical protein